MIRTATVSFLMAIAAAMAPAHAEGATTGERAERMPILTERDRAALEDAWLESRLDHLVPSLMREYGIDMWVLVAREYDEDPVVETMLPATWLSARRRTVLVFSDNGETVERFAVARYPVGTLFSSAWNPEEQPDQWQRLADLIVEADPETIAVNTSSLHSLADGIAHTQYEELSKALPRRYRRRMVSAEDLALGWLETRSAAEMEVYPGIVRIAHDIIDEAFSSAVITPGVTTPDDVRWWMRDKVTELGMEVWFHPSVQIQRTDQYTPTDSGQTLPNGDVIRPGDLLWVDFGITYLGLNTDTQQHAYVLRPGETEAPEGLRAGLAALNRTTDHLTKAFRTGLTSNEILALARNAAIADGLRPSYYSHGIGYHGHGGGSPIGWWDDQSTDHPMGQRPLRPHTAWSIELNTTVSVPEWGGQDVEFRAEEDAYFDGERVRYLDGRQTRLHLIPSE
ncbi:M24 family metallopeptidase [Parvularcula lutaonensis]|uniref:M24 family metallopeptidase n=1 Tax=Parvularcula lutaonensis TaxID=491923 RepID=A0ABV7MCY3_9PROT|nr:M24 family metallopeptidase [Parvularcula lutaonensis]GGY51947.1 Xaa-Pro aminopeptidase [Parvularcula lutaonensis]